MYHPKDGVEDGFSRAKAVVTENSKKWTYGLIAQEVEPIIPHVVSRPADTEKGFYGISYGRLVPWLIQAVIELNARLEALEA